MKYLISFDTNIVRQELAHNWGVEKVLPSTEVLTSDLSVFSNDTEPVAVFIPTVFDYSNSLSYQGANLALRILMCFIRVGRTDIDIVLMGNESEANFLLHYDYPNILKIPGFHYARFNQKVVTSYKLPVREKLNSNEYIPYLDNLGLKIPTSFKSTHSLTNEWCLFKWNSFMGFDGDISVFENHLYFDYLITIEKLNQIRNKHVTDHLKEKIQSIPSTKILLIDDKEGWHCFFKKMFQTTGVNLRCIGEDFNKLEFPDIEKVITDEVNNFKPDIIILDFRLMEDKDAEVTNVKDISGYKVLTKILKGKYNAPLSAFGRQVIIFTATSRIENILMLRDGNADGFILKEKPENYNGKEITKSVISKMISSLETAVTRANFLIPLNDKLGILSEIIIKTNNQGADIGTVINIASQSIRQLTQNNDLNLDVLKLSYLTFYSILESLKDNKREDLNPFIKSKASEIGLNSQTFLLWDDICEIRNCIAHGKAVIDKGKNKGWDLSAKLLFDWSLRLGQFIIEFLKLYLKY